MKKTAFLLITLILGLSLNAQIFEPVSWETSVEKISDTEFDLISVATIDKGWHLYSQNVPEGGPIATTFSYEENINYELVGDTSESDGEEVDDPVFQMRIKYFSGRAEFRQRVKILNSELDIVKGEVEFMSCDDEKCLPPDVTVLEFKLNSSSDTKEEANNEGNIFSNPIETSGILEPVTWTSTVKKLSNNEYQAEFYATIDESWHLYSQEEADGPPSTEFVFTNADIKLIGKTSEPKVSPVFDKVFKVDVKYFSNEALFIQKFETTNKDAVFEAEVYYMTCDDKQCVKGDKVFKMNLKGENLTTNDQNIDNTSLQFSNDLNLNVKGKENYEKQDIKEKSNLTIFFLGFLGGFIALLTPCVFPMIPLTVSFFTKSSGDNKKGVFNSVLYGFFIFLIYFLLSLPFHVLDSADPEILNNISTNVTLNIIFFVIFVAFAFSFFGYYELTLPASWSNALDSKANSIGGIIGIFFMAVTLAIVSFSCTGPILGTLLGSSLGTDSGATQLTLGMSGFGLALALPFSLFAMFPKWLNSLPKSGGWLNTVKVVLGFIELALALKFLSNADLVEHWGLLKREIFIGLWIIIGIGLVLYLFGKIKFPHDSPLLKLGKGRITTGILFLAFVIYLIPGVTNTKYANLKLLSGFPPPMFYSIYDKDSECPLDLNCYKDLDEGIAAAKAANKPIMLDFTGWACVNCRKMEEQVWSKSKVYDMLLENYIIISLYVDDRKELPKEEQFDYIKPNGNKKRIKTIGDKWATLQTINFQNNSQPFYVLLDHNMQMLNHTTAYTPNADEYFEWLNIGLENFRK
ncbi:protein-disulfide reductase DsbD family protein [Ichthyenterobacterium sp. W332]|uniref:Protein-disulfide reductase DsbD family protein n=1 Tax=Microcosmobacter mediterraneus TaxID=3075607 RepID=A0ABU2YP50_9FLAO|nr:protein-disulfide reductase DsbD domain-containing protein [Ichthyenterobacterium sp. W332]MDT0559607.1 protein-disulfide reductase DsbD family protein [Ichthyenterobacterium sp. W332]